MKTKSKKVLPKTAGEITNGGVYVQAVRCGKSNCKCSRGKTHSAFYFFTRRNGKLVKIYIRKAEIAAFTRLIVQVRTRKKEQIRTSQDSLAMLKEFRTFLREKQSVIESIKGS